MTTVTISLPDQIARKIDSATFKQGYATRSEFMRNILRDYFVKEKEFEFEEFEPVSLEKLRAELARTGRYSEEFIDSVVEGFRKSSIYGNKTP